jgi:small nuclear ribonucleoprotein (snRNP)-like protein
MAIFREIRNECLIRELSHELNTDVLLFGFDGFTYFGRLQSIDDCRVAILTPAVVADTTDVEILTPGGELLTTTILRVDLWQIVAKGTGIVSDPIDSPHTGAAPGLQATTGTERQESHELICFLSRMVGECVTITTLGGFLFEGVLGAVKDELAFLTVEDIFGPGTSSSISDRNVRTVVVNLEALTSVSSATTCR